MGETEGKIRGGGGGREGDRDRPRERERHIHVKRRKSIGRSRTIPVPQTNTGRQAVRQTEIKGMGSRDRQTKTERDPNIVVLTHTSPTNDSACGRRRDIKDIGAYHSLHRTTNSGM